MALADRVSERQICVDMHILEEGGDYGHTYSRVTTTDPKRPVIELRTPRRTVVASLADKEPPVILGSKMGSVDMVRDVSTGQTKQVCVENAEDRFGHVIGPRSRS